MKSIPINSSSQVLVLGSVNPIYVPSGSISVALFRFDKFKNPERHKIFASYRPQSSLTNFPRKSRLKSPFGGLLLRKRIKDSAGFLQKWISYVKGFGQPERSPEGWEGEYLQSGGIGMALMTMTSTAKLRVRPFVATLAANPTFVSGLLAWLMAQSTKVFLNFLVERKWDFRIFCASGGMPSSHSALCTALTTSVGLCHGVGDSLFPVCLGFSLVVMYDAVGVRRHAGMQAEVLNMIVDDLFKGHPISQRKLKVLLGHTPLQVLAGVLIGMLVAYLCCQGSFVGS